MPAHPESLPTPVETTEESSESLHDRGYLVICWNDPVNLMAYVTHVFQTVFGWDQKRAQRHMMEVHEKGRSVLVRETFEKAEFYVHQLQGYSLQATLEPDVS